MSFILSGYDYVSAGDSTDLIATPAPADETLNYGGMYWLACGDQYKRVPKRRLLPRLHHGHPGIRECAASQLSIMSPLRVSRTSVPTVAGPGPMTTVCLPGTRERGTRAL